jgi:hypothetical protein
MRDRPLLDRRERTFQLWAYTVGMRRLLLRSTKNDIFRTRVDVLFQNVKALQIPTFFEGLIVADADDELGNRIETETGLLREEARFFRVETIHGVGYIVAGVMVSREDDGEYFDQSDLWPDAP